MSEFEKRMLQAERGRQIFSDWGITLTTRDTVIVVATENEDAVRQAAEYLPQFIRCYHRGKVYVVQAVGKSGEFFLLAGASAVFQESAAGIESLARYFSLFTHFGMGFQLVMLADDDRLGGNLAYPLAKNFFSLEEYIAVGLYRLSGTMLREGKIVSLVVPVYNTEGYLERCIGSLVNQTYRNIEIILVNDGSDDSSGQICQKWAEADDRIVYLEQENRGQGVARNRGVKEAHGDYLMFVDSDDFLELDCISLLMQRITEQDADVCVYSYYTVDEWGHRSPVSLPYNLVTKKTIKEEPALLSSMYPLLWLGIYNISCLRKIKRGMENLMCEDLLYLSEVYLEAEKGICTLDECLYNYNYTREGNLSTSFSRYGEMLSSVEKMHSYYRERNVMDEFWPALYERTVQIMQDFSSRFNERPDLKMSRAMKSAWEKQADDYYSFLDRAYGSRLAVDLLRNNIVALGSTNLGRVLAAMMIEKKYILPDFADSSIISMVSMGGRNHGYLLNLYPNDGYATRQIHQDVSKVFFANKAYEDADVIVTDLLGEMADVLEIEPGCFITEGPYLRLKDNANLKDCRRLTFGSEEHRKQFQAAMKKFAFLLGTDRKVVLVKNYMTESHMKNGIMAAYSNTDSIRKKNEMLVWYYDSFLAYLPEAIVVEPDEFLYTDDSLGTGWPLFYNASYYKRTAVRIMERMQEAND